MTRSPRALSRRPREAAVRPLPRLETTPPVTKMCFATRFLRSTTSNARARPIRQTGDCPTGEAGTADRAGGFGGGQVKLARAFHERPGISSGFPGAFDLGW